MNINKRTFVAALVCCLFVIVIGVSFAGWLIEPSQAALLGEPTVSVVATDLDNPRGLNFGPDGGLYVAEAGTGGAGPCGPGPEWERC